MKTYRPSSGTEGADFQACFCDQCGRDARYQETLIAEYGCPILSASLAAGIDDPLYPSQYWVYGENGKPTCLMFMEEPGPFRPVPEVE